MQQNIFYQLLDGINRCLSPVDKLLNRNPGKSPPPLFIIGPPRSGTTLAYQVITEYFDVAYFCYPYNYLYGLPNLTSYLLKPVIGKPNTDFESEYGKVHGIFNPAEHGNFWFRWFPRDGINGNYVAQTDVCNDQYQEMSTIIYSLTAIFNKPMVFKNVYLTMTAGLLAKIFPEARFVLLKRDLLNIIQSMIKAREQKSTNVWWSVRPPEYKSMLNQPLWKQAAYQIYMSDFIASRELCMQAHDRYKIIQYEDLCTSPVKLMENLNEWLGPYGYRPRKSHSIPNSFDIQNRISLSDELTNKILAYLDILKKNHD